MHLPFNVLLKADGDITAGLQLQHSSLIHDGKKYSHYRL